jgi:hypothetical protein
MKPPFDVISGGRGKAFAPLRVLQRRVWASDSAKRASQNRIWNRNTAAEDTLKRVQSTGIICLKVLQHLLHLNL